MNTREIIYIRGEKKSSIICDTQVKIRNDAAMNGLQTYLVRRQKEKGIEETKREPEHEAAT